MAVPDQRYPVHIKSAVAVKLHRGESPVVELEPGYIVIRDAADPGKNVLSKTTAVAIIPQDNHTIVGVTVDTCSERTGPQTVSVQTAGIACVQCLQKPEGMAFGTKLYTKNSLVTKSGSRPGSANDQAARVMIAAPEPLRNQNYMFVGYVQNYTPNSKTVCVRLAIREINDARAAIRLAVRPELYRNITTAFADTPPPSSILTSALQSVAEVSHNGHVECGFTQVSAAAPQPLSNLHAGVIVEGDSVHVAADSAGEHFFAVPSTTRKSSGKPSKVVSRIGGARIGKAKSPWVHTKMTTEHVLRFQDAVRAAMLSRKPVPPGHFTATLKTILA